MFLSMDAKTIKRNIKTLDRDILRLGTQLAGKSVPAWQRPDLIQRREDARAERARLQALLVG